MKKAIRMVRWLMLVIYVGVFVILGRYHLQMSNFNKFLIIMIIATSLLIFLLWFLRDKKGDSLTQKE
jgi:hypothetical protein